MRFSSSWTDFRFGARLIIGLGLCLSSAVSAQPKSPSVLPGGSAKEPITIEADKLDYLDKEQKAVYSGNVVAKQGDSTLRSQTLTIFLDKAAKDATDSAAAPAAAGPSPQNSQIKRIEAGGPVTISQKDSVGTGDNGVFEKAANTFILNGHVVLTQGGNVQTGDKLTYNLTSGEAKITGGRVKGVFVPGTGASPAPKK